MKRNALHLGLVSTPTPTPLPASPHSSAGRCWACRRLVFLSRTDLRKVCLAIRGFLFCFVSGEWGACPLLCLFVCFNISNLFQCLNVSNLIQLFHQLY